MKTMSYQIPYLNGEAFDNAARYPRVYRIMSPRYTLFLDNELAQVRRYVPAPDAEWDSGTDFETAFAVEHHGRVYEADHMATGEKTGNTRVIEEGHSCIRTDMEMLRYGDDERFSGALEVVAYPEYFAMNYEVRSAVDITGLTLKMSVRLKGRKIVRVGRDRLVAADGKGNNLIFASFDPAVTLRAAGEDTVELTRKRVAVPAKHYDHAGLVVIPTKNTGFTDVKKVFALNDGLSVTAHMTSPEDSVPAVTRDIYGNCRIDITPKTWDADVTSTYEARNRYQKMDFTVRNDSDRDVLVPVCFAYGRENTYRTRIPITGLSPMIRRGGVPCGIQVQLSKTWDGCANDEYVYDDPSLLKQGYWMRATALIPAPRHSEERYEYFCAFENYGGVAAVQHAQLGLMGWGGSQRQWHQLALGSHGETICYSVQGGGVMQDIRGLYVRSAHGGMKEYNWSGNVGGGDFLIYMEPDESPIITWPNNPRNDVADTVTHYRAQCPILTDVTYVGHTRDGRIDASYNVMLGSTDDAARHYHVLRYDFRQDTPFARLSFYSHPSERYAPPCQRKLAFGADDREPRVRHLRGKPDHYRAPSFKGLHFPAGRFPWAMAYDADFLRCEPGMDYNRIKEGPFRQSNLNTLMIVRELHGRVNGKRLTKLDYNLFDINTWGLHSFGYELVLPKKFGDVVRAGSWIEMTVELVVLPADPGAYYGDSEIITDNLDKLNSPAIAPVFVMGNALEVTAEVGRVTRTYPPRIRCASGEEAARFRLRGGLGYTPITFTGIKADPAKLQLQVLVKGKFRPVYKENPTGEEGDDVQIMATDKGFDAVYAVKNARFNAGDNVYRLVVKD
ncbi:MAG: hypothetical protein KIG36_00550 [Eubacteriales bacterium]|nr:hypothetical protein [Eubacteriales bacterium]